MEVTADESNTEVVASDTKVLRRGEGGGLYFATTGIAYKATTKPLGLQEIKPGDKVLVSGSLDDHGIAVTLAREAFGLRGDVRSDSASVLPFTKPLLEIDRLRFMRDPTRGGFATVCHEIKQATGLGVRLEQTAIPLKDAVQSVCDILGYAPLYLACEGRVVALVAPEQAEETLQRWQGIEGGEQAAVVGEITSRDKHVVLVTELGGERILEELEDDPLPRIC
ncbi:MAG: HypE family hydrogenase expression/formation protein [bacterium]